MQCHRVGAALLINVNVQDINSGEPLNSYVSASFGAVTDSEDNNLTGMPDASRIA